MGEILLGFLFGVVLTSVVWAYLLRRINKRAREAAEKQVKKTAEKVRKEYFDAYDLNGNLVQYPIERVSVPNWADEP